MPEFTPPMAEADANESATLVARGPEGARRAAVSRNPAWVRMAQAGGGDDSGEDDDVDDAEEHRLLVQAMVCM